MATAFTSHITFFSELRTIPSEVIDQAAPWIAFYREHRDLMTQLIYPLLNDPLENGWTALQSWNPEEGKGALLAFRQESEEQTQTIALKNVPEGRSFDLFTAPDMAPLGTVTSADLTNGLEITLPEKNTAEVVLIVPHQG